MTPHNKACKGEIAKTVLMPGDPLRAKMIAEEYLTDYKLVNDVRNMYCYTGYYKNKKISVMASGMGIPSIGIYSYELYNIYDVDNIIRIGSAGAYSSSINLYEILVVSESYSLSSYAKVLDNYDKDVVKSSEELNSIIKSTATKLGKKYLYGKVHSSDCFYNNLDINDLYNNKQCLAVEMETFGLFYNALKSNKKAASILTVSDNLVTHKETSSEERQNSFKDMVLIALESAINL